MKIYKIAEEEELQEMFPVWLANQIINVSGKYARELQRGEHHWLTDPNIVNSIIEIFSESITSEELKRISLTDLYVIAYALDPKIQPMTSRRISSRLGGIKHEWILNAVQNFPDILEKYVYPYLIEELNQQPMLFSSVPIEVRFELPEELRNNMKDFFENKLKNKSIAFSEVPYEIRSNLSPETKSILVEIFASMYKDFDNFSSVPEEIRQEVLETIQARREFK